MPYFPGNAGGAADGVNIVSAGTQIAGTNATVVFSNANNVSFGMNNSSVVTASASVAAGAGDGVNILAAGTQTANSTGTVNFADSNGVSFGMSDSTQITATVRTDYQSSGNYLTTARASNDAVGLNTAKTNATWTVNSSGISLDAGAYLTTAQPVGAYLTTAMQSNAVTLSNIKVSGGASSLNLSAITFSDSNGISFGLSNNSVMTATVKTDYQSSGAYLTTAAQSSASNISGVIAGTASNAATNQSAQLSGAVSFSNTNGVSFQTTVSGAVSGIAATVATNYQSQGAYLTTARASNDAIGLNTAFTNVTATVNSSGLSINAAGYAGTATAATNATFTLNSAGLSLSVGAGGAGDGVNILAAGTQTAATTGSVKFADSNGVVFGMSNSSQITASYTVPTISSWTVSDNATSATVGRLAFTQANGLTMSLSTSNNGNHTVIGSYTVPTVTNSSFSVQDSATTINPVNRIAFSTGNNITLSLSTGASSATVGVAHNLAGVSTGFAGNLLGGSMTHNSSGLNLSLSHPAWLTTAAQSSASNLSGVIAATASNAATNQTAQLSGAISFTNTNGVSFYTTASGAVSGIGATVATNYQSQGAYLTTARASNDAVGLNTAATSVTWTVNSSGISLNAGAYLTTAAASNHSHGNPTLALTNLTGTTASASNGLTLSLSAAAPGGGVGIVAGTRTATTAGSLLFDNANGITFGLNGNGSSIMTASHNAITTARASTDALGLATAQSNVTWTANSAGVSLDARGYAGTATGATNASVTVNSGGVSVSVAAPGAAAENNWFNLLGVNTAGNTTASGSTIGLSGVNLTLSGTNASAINISAPATSSLVGTNGISISSNGSTISISNVAVTYSRYNEFKESPLVAGNIGQGSLHLQPWLIPNLQFDRVVIHKAFSNATNSSNSFTVTDRIGIYTQNVSTLSLLHSTSATTNFSGSGTAGSYLSYGGGIKAITVGLTQTLTEGMYWIGVIQSTTTGGGAGHTLDQALNSNLNSSYRGLMGVATNATNQMSLGFGAYSAATAAMPNSIAFTEIRGNSSVFLRPPSLYFVSGTI